MSIEAQMRFIHCDVFSARPYGGNGLAVFPDAGGLTAPEMLAMTRELRHFESIFLRQENGCVHARVFDLFEELPFAGHPLIGAASTLAQVTGETAPIERNFVLSGGREVRVDTACEAGVWSGRLDQGRPAFGRTIDGADRTAFAEAFSLHGTDLAHAPVQVVSTGLEYLVVPVRRGLERARIAVPDLGARLEAVGARFACLLDVEAFEIRHWNNDGVQEDVATGSAAGTVAAWCRRHGLLGDGETRTLAQGRFLDRPSELHVRAHGDEHDVQRVSVTGDVAFVGEGRMVRP